MFGDIQTTDGGILSRGAFGATKACVSTSPATNCDSNLIWSNSSVWTGSVAANRWMTTRLSPGKSGNNAHIEYQIVGTGPSTSYSYYTPSTFFGVND